MTRIVTPIDFGEATREMARLVSALAFGDCSPADVARQASEKIGAVQAHRRERTLTRRRRLATGAFLAAA